MPRRCLAGTASGNMCALMSGVFASINERRTHNVCMRVMQPWQKCSRVHSRGFVRGINERHTRNICCCSWYTVRMTVLKSWQQHAMRGLLAHHHIEGAAINGALNSSEDIPLQFIHPAGAEPSGGLAELLYQGGVLLPALACQSSEYGSSKCLRRGGVVRRTRVITFRWLGICQLFTAVVRASWS